MVLTTERPSSGICADTGNETTMVPIVNNRTETYTITRLPTARNWSDAEIVDGLKQKDPQMAAAFFDRYNGTVNRLVWKLMLSDTDHDDVVHTAFLQMYASIRHLKEPQALPRWVSTVTLHTVRKEIRKRRYTRLFTILTDTPEDFPTSPDSPFRDSVDQVRRIVETMTPDNRILFVLHYVEGHTFEEIASLWNCSLATVKRCGKRCKREFMRKAIKDSVLSRYFEEHGHA